MKKQKTSFAIAYSMVFFILSSLPIFAGNPFLSGPDQSQKEKIERSKQSFSNSEAAETDQKDSKRKSIFLSNPLLEELKSIQKSIHAVLSDNAKKVKDAPSFWNLFLLFSFSFLYGIFHAAGPGHGKAVVFSYFLSRESKAIRAIVLGSTIGIIHAASAITLVIILKWILESYLSSMDAAGSLMQSISYALILAIGLYMLFDFIKDMHSKSKEQPLNSEISEKRSMISIAIAVGLVPCPGVVLIMIFGFSLDIFFISLIASMFMAFGMAFTISFAGLLTMAARKGLMRLASDSPRKFNVLHSIMSLSGIFFLLVFSIIMLFGSIA